MTIGYAETPYKIHASERKELDAGLAGLDIAKLTISVTDTPRPLPDLKALPFGMSFSDHMAIASFHPASGWSPPEIKPYAPLTLDPASCCLHYCANVFEGMKVCLGPDGKARLFRPDMNMRRLERSAARLALPPIDGDAVLDLIKRLVQTEKRWIPTFPGYSLYLRPTIIGTRPGRSSPLPSLRPTHDVTLTLPALGTAASDHALLYILACPSGSYFQHPISLLAVSEVVRAWPGGTGEYKVGGNYAPGFLPQREAAAQGYDHVLWLFGKDRQVTEGGAMNIFVVLKRASGDGLDVITPPLDGTILPGVTRASCLTLASDPDFYASISISPSPSSSATATTGTTLHPAERTFTMADLECWSTDGTLFEVLCVGTAATVCAVHRIGFEGRNVHVPTYPSDANGLGPVGKALKARILRVQEGREEYEGWGVVCE
ncbi:aminotransferase [Lanmaoa asiatica]|nr:aminotransferase [Lanmaoa asiatica]